MKRDLIIADEFYDDPDAVVRHAHSLEYVYPYWPDRQWEASRFRSAKDCPFKSSEALIAKLEWLTGERVDRAHWDLDFPLDERGYLRPDYQSHERSCLWNCCFHAKYHRGQRLGEGVHNHVVDGWNSVGEDGWTGLVYLNPDADKQSGLRTWQNRDRSHNYDWMTGPENWILVDTLAAVYNRLVLHRGNIPHSGTAGWGHDVRSGRLYQTFFFKTTAVARVPTLALGVDLAIGRGGPGE